MGVFNLFKSAEHKKQQSDGDKLFMIAFGGIVEIKKHYKEVSHEGKVQRCYCLIP